MKTSSLITKAFFAICGIAIAYFLLHAKFATYTEPKDILSAVDLDIPEYKIVSEDNNLDRGASRWDWHSYEISFPIDDTTKILRQLKSDGWKYDFKHANYYKSKVIDADLAYSATVYPKESKARLEVEIDELYNFVDILIIIAIAFLGISWGVLYLIIKWIHERRNKQS
mgnify:CR=1 FL=1